MKPTLRAAVAACLVLLLCVVLAEAIGPASAATPLGAAPTAAAATGAARPPIVQDPIPFGPKRKREMAAYSERHYGEDTWRLTHPHVIVEHMSEASSVAADFNTFADDVPDVELHELPQVCAHFVVGSSGRIFQMVNLRTRCRHTVGLNWTAIGIEHIGYPDSDVLDNARQFGASLQLTQYLRCRFHIKLTDVIGHNESLSSPYHRELVPSLKNQTHGDWKHSSMRVYRKALWRLGPC
jgi:N-acetylmuramoyl-L-alanine amidase-like protein